MNSVHDELDGGWGLATLARRSGYSPFHFHRRFVEATGETPKQHVLRIRLERAAYLIAVSDERVLPIALSVGFNSHETFTRAFRRLFGVSPIQYRLAAKKAQAERLARNAGFTGDGCELSDVWFGTLPRVQLLCVRHTGAYADIALPPFGADEGLWQSIAAWAQAAGVLHERTGWAISLDDPTVTPGPNQRLDACLPVAGTPAPPPPFKLMEFAGGRYAGVEHQGPHDSIAQAYRHVADGIRRSTSSNFGAGPPIQIFRHLDQDPNQNRTEVYFPIARR